VIKQGTYDRLLTDCFEALKHAWKYITKDEDLTTPTYSVLYSGIHCAFHCCASWGSSRRSCDAGCGCVHATHVHGHRRKHHGWGAHRHGRHGCQLLVLPLAKQACHARHHWQVGDSVWCSARCDCCCGCCGGCCCCQGLLLACELRRWGLVAVEDLLVIQGQLPVPAVNA
jgi:hypothetical protein